METEEIVLYCKGADNVIIERLDTQEQDQQNMIEKTADFVEDYAKDGLRTLYLAKKTIDEDTYNNWNELQKKASTELKNREEAVAKVNDMIE